MEPLVNYIKHNINHVKPFAITTTLGFVFNLLKLIEKKKRRTKIEKKTCYIICT